MKKTYDLTLIANNKVATDTIELVFTKPENYNFKLGQYTFLYLENDENLSAKTSRPLSISSHPNEKIIRFVMRTSDSEFKKLCISLKEGDKGKITDAIGNFSLKYSDKNIVFLISGIGIAPVIPFLMELEKNNYKGNVTLFYSNRTEDKATYKDKISKFKIDNFKFYPIYTGLQPRINSELLINKLGNLKESFFYIVGTSDFIKSMKIILEENQLTKNDYLIDNFG